jgi:hypothetical protein
VLPFEFVVFGTPLSAQARDRDKLKGWKDTVTTAAAACWPQGTAPFQGQVTLTVSHYYKPPKARLDNDNLSKPIQDALNKLVYTDDSLVVVTHTSRLPIDALYFLPGVSPVLLQAFSPNLEFVHVRVEAFHHTGKLP